MAQAPTGPTGPVPPIEVVQTDIGFANQYRLELIKPVSRFQPRCLPSQSPFVPVWTTRDGNG